tara:strand:- start:14602 stop:15063 length:462 start_codon:yes stop_codon:yes gene_type:complete
MTKKTDPENVGSAVMNILNKRIQSRVNNVKKAVTRGTLLVRSDVIKAISSPGTGRTYEKYNPRRTHTASKGGEAPATDTGFLISQVSSNVKVEGQTVIGQIISAAPYSKFLEFGHVARDGSFVQARPYMQPSLEKNKKKIKDIFVQEGVISRK